MAGDRRKSQYGRRPDWQMHRHRIESVLADALPDRDGYSGSRWHEWERRIQQGHAAEEKRIERLCEERRKQPAYDPQYDPDEWAGEDYLETCRLTNSMYAALVVSIWSEMEHFLKHIVIMCYQALEKRRKALERALEFCEDSLAHRQPNVTLEGCLKALKELQSEVPYAFGDIEKALKSELGIRVGHCREYATVNGIRILNNSFKHARGRYDPDKGKPHEQIDKGLLKKWPILEGRKDIDYSKLPVRDLVVACNAFCRDLLDKVEAALNQRTTGRGGNE